MEVHLPRFGMHLAQILRRFTFFRPSDVVVKFDGGMHWHVMTSDPPTLCTSVDSQNNELNSFLWPSIMPLLASKPLEFYWAKYRSLDLFVWDL